MYVGLRALRAPKSLFGIFVPCRVAQRIGSLVMISFARAWCRMSGGCGVSGKSSNLRARNVLISRVLSENSH